MGYTKPTLEEIRKRELLTLLPVFYKLRKLKITSEGMRYTYYGVLGGGLLVIYDRSRDPLFLSHNTLNKTICSHKQHIQIGKS